MRPSGRANRWTSYSTRSGRTRPARQNVCSPQAWPNGGGRTRSDGALIPGAVARIDRSMDVAIAREGRHLTRGLNVSGASCRVGQPVNRVFPPRSGDQIRFRGELRWRNSPTSAVVAPALPRHAGNGSGSAGRHSRHDLLQQAERRQREILSGYEAFADEFNTHFCRPIGRCLTMGARLWKVQGRGAARTARARRPDVGKSTSRPLSM